jgi:hypothetical protein
MRDCQGRRPHVLNLGSVTRTPVTIDELQQWTLFGAQWRVVAISEVTAEVEFCTCTGEAVERRQTGDPDVIRYLRTASLDREPG